MKQTDDSASVLSEIVFSGRVQAGEHYRCGFIRGFVFQLDPTSEGWEIAVREDKHDENLARLTPSVNGRSPLLIAGSDFRNETGHGTNPGGVKTLPDERKFTFSPIAARGGGLLSIKSIGWGSQLSEKPTIAEMSFDVSIHLQTIDGVPIYGAENGAKPPQVTRTRAPEYSKEALKANYQGTVVLWVIVAADGTPRNIKIARSLGMGLDEKAIEAVRTWRFKPAMKDGEPVPVQINVEVTFRR